MALQVSLIGAFSVKYAVKFVVVMLDDCHLTTVCAEVISVLVVTFC